MFVKLFDTCYPRYCVEGVFEVNGEGADTEGFLLEGMLEVMKDDFTPPWYTHTVLVGEEDVCDLFRQELDST